MTRILFVDDEPMVLRSLDRAMRAQRKPWQATFVGSGEDALAVLEREPFDVIVSDISMPTMDGITLLHNVRERFPHITRLALSGDVARQGNLRAVLVIHQWLSKPCPLQKLTGTIERLAWSRALIEDPAVLAATCGMQSLPSAPTLYLRVTTALERDAALSEIVAMIETDPAIAAKLLQLVNSAFFGQAQRVVSVQRAATILGVDRLREMLLAAEVFRSGAASEELSAHSLFVARLARSLAPAADGDDAFLAGLLHDLGELALVDPSATAAASPTLHARIAGMLLGTWGLPDEVVNAVAFHHDPELAPNNTDPTLRALALAEALAGELAAPDDPSAARWVDELALACGHDAAACRARAVELAR